jgi:hypothetical protein
MKGPDVTLTNGRYEFRSPRRGTVLYLADPPEAGWRTGAATDDAGAPSRASARRSRPMTRR